MFFGLRKMKNKNVGFLIVGIAIVIGIIILIFNLGLKNIVSQTCSHGSSCTMYDTIFLQTWISFAIALLVFIIGLFLIFSKEHEKIVIKKIKPIEVREIKKQFKKQDLEKFDIDERKILQLILDNEGSLLQSELVNKTGFDKVKVTRLLDRLEGKGVIERRRRGMTNVVILK